MSEFNFVGKSYDAQITKHDPNAPLVYGKVWETASKQLVAELIWRYADQDKNRPKCDVPGIFWQEVAKQVGTTHDNWNIKNRKNLFAWHVRNAICEEVGLQPVQIKEQEVPNQAPKAVKKQVQQPQQTVQAPVQQAATTVSTQNSKVQELLNSRVQLRGDQQTAASVQTTATMPSVEIFTDGACSGNPGPGGWGVILRMGNHEKELNGGELSTTNNCMELRAGIEALKALKKPCDVVLTSDSKYLVKGATEWLSGWLKKNWKNSKGEEVANKELWEELIPLLKVHSVKFNWVKGHNGHPENERCDALARAAIDQLQQKQVNQMEDDPNLYDYLPDDDDNFYDPEEE